MRKNSDNLKFYLLLIMLQKKGGRKREKKKMKGKNKDKSCGQSKV